MTQDLQQTGGSPDQEGSFHTHRPGNDPGTGRPARVEIFYFDAGGGHRAAMLALKEALTARNPHWHVVPVDLQKLLEPVDPIYRLTGRVTTPLRRVLTPIAPNVRFGPVQTQSIYNTALKTGVTYGVGAILPMLKLYIRRHAPRLEQELRRHWAEPGSPRPDIVVSVIPNFNGVMFRALRAVHAHVPYVTVMTDMVDCPPRFWMEDQDQVIVCGTDRALAQARATGFYDPANIVGVSGMMLGSRFYDLPAEPRLTRHELGLSPDRPTALIMFGGNGALVSERIVEKLRTFAPDVQTIVMCGRNRTLLRTLQGVAGCHAVGFVPNVADYMRLADFFIGKPGPGSISEAIHMGCPVIVQCNNATMPQERPNVDWVLNNGIGLSVRSFRRNIVDAVRTMTTDLERFRQAIRRNVRRNQAVFEVAALVERIAAAPAATPAPACEDAG
ncbi:glycosyltransferase [Rhodovastum atsumiense]|uniref:glycosyltransferase n=1 Tax=Rhodovastum atsumiense TaxID=504468 RepID=UPI00139F2939|nr:glycosyltransferase [Rhodovastum atsumiense]